MSYYDIYQKRLNRFGQDVQSRISSQRAREFDNYLVQSVYRVSFTYGGATCYATLEPNKQTHSQTQSYLLTQKALTLPNGTILNVVSANASTAKWMVWWMDNVENTGYNRYIVLRINQVATIGANSYDCYLSGPGLSTIDDIIKSPSGRALYAENNNMYMMVLPLNAALQKGAYATFTVSGTNYGYTITDVDVTTSTGIAYVSLDPVPLRASTSSSETAISWLNGGN